MEALSKNTYSIISSFKNGDTWVFTRLLRLWKVLGMLCLGNGEASPCIREWVDRGQCGCSTTQGAPPAGTVWSSFRRGHLYCQQGDATFLHRVPWQPCQLWGSFKAALKQFDIDSCLGILRIDVCVYKLCKFFTWKCGNHENLHWNKSR